MDRTTWFVAAAALSCAALSFSGCQQPASTSSAGPRTIPTEGLESEAFRVLLDGLADPNPRIRANAVEVVALTREVLLMPKVQRLFRDPAIPVRFLAVLTAGDLEYALAEGDIAAQLNDKDTNIQIAAAYAMTKLGHAEHFPAIRDAVASEDQTVRANAALLLGKCERKDAVRFLYWALRDQNSADKVVLQAAESIAALGDERIYPKLWSRLISAYADDRVIGIRGMGLLGTEEAKNALITMLDDPVLEVRLAAAAQLGKLNEPTGESEVLQVFQKNLLAQMDAQGAERVKVLAALAIGELGTKSLTKHLPDLLADSSKTVRLAAAKAVLQTSGPKN